MCVHLFLERMKLEVLKWLQEGGGEASRLLAPSCKLNFSESQLNLRLRNELSSPNASSEPAMAMVRTMNYMEDNDP